MGNIKDKTKELLDRSVKIIIGSDHIITTAKQGKQITAERKKRCKGICKRLKPDKIYKRFSIDRKKCIVCDMWYSIPIPVENLPPTNLLVNSNDFCSCCGFILQFNSDQPFDVTVEHNYSLDTPLIHDFPTDPDYIKYDMELISKVVIKEKLYLIMDIDKVHERFKYLRFDYFLYIILLIKNKRLLVDHAYKMTEDIIKQEKNRVRIYGRDRWSYNCFETSRLVGRYIENFLFQSLMYKWHEEKKIMLSTKDLKQVVNPSAYSVLNYTIPFKELDCVCKFHKGVEYNNYWQTVRTSSNDTVTKIR